MTWTDTLPSPRGGRSAACALFVLALGFSGALLAAGADPGAPGDTPLRCTAVEEGVLLEWDPIVWILPANGLLPIEGYAIARDGETIAKLPPDATSYLDREASPGTHRYALIVINWTGDEGVFAECTVTVPQPGLRCKVDGRMVFLEWGPILIDVWIWEFRVFRNKELIATLPNDVLSYIDRAPDVGDYVYEVDAVVSRDASFLVGRCKVHVACFNLEVQVRGLEVDLSWTLLEPVDPGGIVPPPGAGFAIQRDDEIVGRTQEEKYTDVVPAPGFYVYRIWMLLGDMLPAQILVAACEVEVPGISLPPPQDLTCTVLEVAPEPIPIPVDGTLEGLAIDSDGDGVDDSILPPAAVVLEWRNPVRYEKIVITRNRAIIATLPGDATRYVDRVDPGVYVYGVRGLRGTIGSPPATCEVVVEPGYVPPPQDFRCFLVNAILDPSDPDVASAGLAGEDDGGIPVRPIVAMTWWNPIPYAQLVLLRDGVLLAELPGTAMRYRDLAPPPGLHVYELFGVALNGARSKSVFCRIFVAPEPVPPVEDLACFSSTISPESIPPDAVLLLWRNPLLPRPYDAIVILRDGTQIAELPGTAQRYVDGGLAPGIYRYDVIAVLGGEKSPPASCEVVVPGPPARNLLYFTPRYPLDPADSDAVTPLPPRPGNRITCRAANARPLQGWSFGVASDPKFVVPVALDLEDTATQALNGGHGPDFLFLEVVEDLGGVVMAAIINTDDTATEETLPPGTRHRILNIAYGAGPSGTAGDVYPIRYSSSLGDPPVQVLFVVDGYEVRPATRPGWVSLPEKEFIRGDADESGELQITDAMRILTWLFLGGPKPRCMDAADANASAEVNIADPIYILSYLFIGGPEPPAPFPFCGAVPPVLGCERHKYCEHFPDTADEALKP